MQSQDNNVLAAPTLRDFLFGSEELEGIKPTTKGIGDTALVLVRPTYIGKAVALFDNDENLLHVEYAGNAEKEWAEIWLTREWKESNARRSRQQAYSSAERIERDKRNKRITEIKQVISAKGLDRKPGFAEHLADGIYKAWQQGKHNEMFKLLELTEKLNTYETEDKTGNQTGVQSQADEEKRSDFGQTSGQLPS
jgi:hypothetical protein